LIADQILKLLPNAIEASRLTDGSKFPNPQHLFGTSGISFSDFRDGAGLLEERRVMALTLYANKDGTHLAICLYCSMDNFSEILRDEGEARSEGEWTFSSAPAVAEFIANSGKITSKNPWTRDPNLIAMESVKLALDVRDINPEHGRGWSRRPLAFAQMDGDAEWVAEVYHDAALENIFTVDRSRQYDPALPPLKISRIVVGAPLWIRTKSVRSLRLADEWSEQELDANQESRIAAQLKMKRWARMARLVLLHPDELKRLSAADPTFPDHQEH
jgi:hypothetical protein